MRRRVTEAHNQHARIFRTWTPGGRLVRELSQIRPLRYEDVGAELPETDFAKHTYKLAFSYDLVGRRTSMIDSSAVRACSSASCSQTYAFSASTGLLSSVVDPQNRTYSFKYTARGQLDTLHYPGAVWEHPTYDGDGNVTRKIVKKGATTFLDDKMTYDIAGRIVADTGIIVKNGYSRHALLVYSGLGHLAYSKTQLGGEPTREEQFSYDGLGNQVWSLRHHVSLGNIDNPAERETFYDDYGRFDYSWAPDTLDVTDYKVAWYDSVGRLAYRGTTSNTWGSGQSTEYAEEAHYYDGLGRLAMLQRKSNDLQQHSNPDDPSAVIERYRYDALGRRVMVHTNRIDYCVVAGCDRSVRRFVWDGDNILHEIRQKASDTTLTSVVDNDAPTGHGVGSYSYNQFGRSYYVHAGGIDRPLAVIRLQSTNTVLAAFSLLSNWRGLYEGGTNASGALITNSITWPGEAASAYLGVAPLSLPDEWMGSLVVEQADASGLMYRRNRYYDPGMGRFTQPDPIGLAGGLNLYGYAGGDPINFADPFGLCPDSLSTAEAEECRRKEAEAAEAEAKAAEELNARCMAAQRTLVTAALADGSVLIGARAIQGAFKALSTATRYAPTSANAAGFANGVRATGQTGAAGAVPIVVGATANGLAGDSWYHFVPGLNVMSRIVDQYTACSDKY